jgi:hypothetical protein
MKMSPLASRTSLPDLGPSSASSAGRVSSERQRYKPGCVLQHKRRSPDSSDHHMGGARDSVAALAGTLTEYLNGGIWPTGCSLRWTPLFGPPNTVPKFGPASCLVL